MRRWWLAVALAVAAWLAGTLAVGMFAALAAQPGTALSPTSGIPPQLLGVIEQAASSFCDLPPELLAAVLKVESNFDNQAVSAKGAMTMAQFLPATWTAWAVNGNPDADQTVSTQDTADVIHSAARYLCALGAGNPDTQRLAVAAYNAGPAAVRRFHGIPPYPETIAYVRRVFAQAAAYATDAAAALPTGMLLGRVLAFAYAQIGTPYRWGGDGSDRFYDCSGFTMRAYAQAGVRLPRTSRAQYQASPHVDRAHLQPGDLLFWAHDTGDPATIHHVAIYLGRDSVGHERMIDAPHTGATIQVRDVYWNGFAGATRPIGAAL